MPSGLTPSLPVPGAVRRNRAARFSVATLFPASTLDVFLKVDARHEAHALSPRTVSRSQGLRVGRVNTIASRRVRVPAALRRARAACVAALRGAGSAGAGSGKKMLLFFKEEDECSGI